MSRLDVVIFGATGFTGTRAVEELARVAEKYGVSAWGVAGRSQSKLETLVRDVGNKTGKDLSSVRVIIAEVNDDKSLEAMCSQAKVLVNCCGPYRLYGEPVVKAAIHSKTHYVDVSGEPQFIESMQLIYDEPARSAGVFIISACGFDSIPCDMGVVFLQQRFDGTLHSVESYLQTDVSPELRAEAARTGAVHYGTWESLVYSIANWQELGPLRKKLYPDRLPTFEPKLRQRGVVHRRDGRWCLPFPGSDLSVVHRSQRRAHAAGQRPVQFRPYVKMPGLLAAIFTVFVAAMLFLLAKFRVTRALLLRHPRVFSCGMISRGGPSDAVMENTRFSFLLHGAGWAPGQAAEGTPRKTTLAKVSGVNPGYGATTTMLVFSAITILRERDAMPPGGGVVTTAIAFRDTKLIDHLNDNNVKFQIVEDKQL